MANYDVDIEIALRGAEKIRSLQADLKSVTREVGRVNAATIKLGKALEKNFSRRNIENTNNYSNAVRRAERALRNAAAGTDAEKRAVSALVTAQKEYNAQLDRQNKLLREEERLQGVERPSKKSSSKKTTKDKPPKPGFQSFGVSGIDFMPIGGSTNIPGSPKARQAKSQARFGSAVSAGAFPLLFGGGPGMALGGALGGAISGSTFGPASIALQVLGGAFDELAAQAASLGAALNPATADVGALVEALGLVGSPIQDSISSLEELAGQQVALEAATRQLSMVVGDDGVQALADLGEASTQFGNALTQVTTQVLAQIAKLTGGIVKEIANTVEVGALLTAAKASDDPRQKELQEKLAGVRIKPGERGINFERAQIEAKMVELQREIRAEEEGRLQAAVERARAGSVEHTIAKNNLAIAQLDGDLTNKQVFDLERKNILQEARKKRMQEGADIKLIELERDRKLQELTNKRDAQIESANDKAERAAKRQSKAADNLATKQQRAIDRRVEAVKRELERTDKAFDRASSQLDAITQKHEDKMAFEREYSRLIQEGSTPAAAKQAVELQKQLLALDRIYEEQLAVVDAQIFKTESSLQDLQNQKGVTTEYQEQLKALDELKKKRDKLKGKKGKAKGAIEEDLAPETSGDKIQAEMDRVQEALNDLTDPANQVILAANAIGSAFSDAFKAVITGSKGANEALADMMESIAGHFLDMAAQIITKQITMIVYGTILKALGVTMGGGDGLNIDGVQQYVTEPFNPGDFTNAFSPRANGGPITSNMPYIVGERGPELFVPNNSGSIMSNADTRAALSDQFNARNSNETQAALTQQIAARGTSDTRAALEQQMTTRQSNVTGMALQQKPIDVRFESTVINETEYVTAEQHRQGMAQAAEQGRALTFAALQNNVKARRRIGL